MKRKIILLSIFVIISLFIVGCKKNEISNNIWVNFEDTNHHFLTTFTYDLNSDYEFSYKNDNDEIYSNMQITINHLNIKIEMNYDELSKEQYDINRESISNYKNYQTYLFNGYDAYTFSSSDDDLYSIIIFGNDKENFNPSIYMSFSLIDDSLSTDIKKAFDNKELQDFFKSVVFKRTN